ncbi:MAG: hypothetical protein MUQ10_01860, partial [Anaerolineae bacterium]|nr:hypothetical protein [Anaerolineae bacterium]
YPRYISGEGGIVYAWDGVSFDSGLGWKACGSFEKYLATIAIFNEKCLAWNKEHANRFAGMTLFGYANWGWDNFELGDGDVTLLQGWATGDRASAQLSEVADDLKAYISSLESYLSDTTYIDTAHRERLSNLLDLTKAKRRAR